MNITPHEEKCQQVLGDLEIFLNKLRLTADEIVESAKCLDLDDDHLGFMALCFLRRQSHHVCSIVTLVPNRDAILIARSMIEGLCMLLWAAQQPEERPLKWRSFVYIQDWRLQQEKIDRGESIDPNDKNSIDLGIKNYGDLFFTKAAQSAIDQKQPLPSDPYHKTWMCGTSIKDICDCVNAGDLHKKVYSSFSDWHHWDTASIGNALSWNESTVNFSPSSSSQSAMALATGFQCLLQTIELVNEHLSCAKESQIAEIRDGYIKWHQDNDRFQSIKL